MLSICLSEITFIVETTIYHEMPVLETIEGKRRRSAQRSIPKDHPEDTTNPEAHQSFPRVYIFRAPVCMNMVSSLGTIASGRIPKVFFCIQFSCGVLSNNHKSLSFQDELIDQPL
jgi:hypothetical protein